ncbi:hypothetical protein BB559_004436 [Furculomyces boomerangus]|uniref:Cyclin-like domain-containing protein n=1 Tax=Furculomyces boomerangus TaxID=61424 RepID=A0A2T9YEU2_9FUNG|nr:hypothetical protein BB559_004436 [Furculomyces boomerangus]
MILKELDRNSLLDTPSLRAGFSFEEEIVLRSKACNIIQLVSGKLQLSQLTTATACVLLHRFYMFNSLKDYHQYNAAAICLFLSCKIEENMRRLEDFIPALVFYVSKGKKQAPPASTEYETWRHIILNGEIDVLSCIGFEMVFEHPFKVPLCIMFSPKTIAAGCINLALNIVDNTNNHKIELESLWENHGLDKEDIDMVGNWILLLYIQDERQRHPYRPVPDSSNIKSSTFLNLSRTIEETSGEIRTVDE